MLEIQNLIDRCEQPISMVPSNRFMHHIKKYVHTRREMQLRAQIGNYDMDEVVLDLGLEVNVLAKQTCELMGRPKLRYSPIQLILANQQRVCPMGRLSNIPVDIDGVWSLGDFEVIEIIDDSRLYPMLLGIEWEFDNLAVINMKKKKMTFKGHNIRFIALLDPSMGPRYTKPIRAAKETRELTNFYRMTTTLDDYIKPTTDGMLSWNFTSSCTSDLDEGLENWKTRLYEVSGRICT